MCELAPDYRFSTQRLVPMEYRNVREVLVQQIAAARGALDQLEERLEHLSSLRPAPAGKVSVALTRAIEAVETALEKGIGGTPKT